MLLTIILIPILPLLSDFDGEQDWLCSQNMVAQCVLNYFRIIAKTQTVHQTILVKGHSSGREIQDVSDLFHRTALREQLQHVKLSISKFAGHYGALGGALW